MKLRAALAPPLVARLDKVIDAGDAEGLALAKALARTLDVPIRSARAGLVAHDRRAAVPARCCAATAPTTVLVLPAGGGRPGVAFMREEVSRAEYAAFASSTGRPVARCRNRLAPINIKKRTWDRPGLSRRSATIPRSASATRTRTPTRSG